MNEHVHQPRLKCSLAGCMGTRWPDSALCTGHWRLLTARERTDLCKLLFALAAAAIEGDQTHFDEVREGVFQHLAVLTEVVDQRMRASA